MTGSSTSAASMSQSISAQPSPTSTIPTAPAHNIDKDYDEGVADALMGLASVSYRAPKQAPTFTNGLVASSAGRLPLGQSPPCELPATRAQYHRRARVLHCVMYIFSILYGYPCYLVTAEHFCSMSETVVRHHIRYQGLSMATAK